MRRTFSAGRLIFAANLLLGPLACGSSAPSQGDTGAGASDGAPDLAGTGGSPGSGGLPGSGGVGTGGVAGLGGVPGSGGGLGTGGTTASGGSDGAAREGSGGSTGAGGEYGFTYRSPGSHTVSCTGATGVMTVDAAPDMDWLCTFNQANQKGYVYIRATVTSAECLGMGAIPVYTTELAQLSIDGVVTSLANAQYNYGGNHNNDYVTFDYQAASYKYYHSSFGWGWHACHPMDCVNIYAAGSTTPTTEGCTSVRSLPEICVPIEAGGTHAPLVDTFEKCPGDTG